MTSCTAISRKLAGQNINTGWPARRNTLPLGMQLIKYVGFSFSLSLNCLSASNNFTEKDSKPTYQSHIPSGHEELQNKQDLSHSRAEGAVALPLLAWESGTELTQVN